MGGGEGGRTGIRGVDLTSTPERSEKSQKGCDGGVTSALRDELTEGVTGVRNEGKTS